MMRVGIDIGGTFTDVVARVEGHFVTAKVPSTPEDPSEAVAHALEVIAARTGHDLRNVIALNHGTTVGTNAAIQGKFAPIGLLTTRGFADVLAVGRQTRQALYDLHFRGRRVLVPAERRLEIDERTEADGSISSHPDRAEVRGRIEELLANGMEVLCVGFMHSYANPANELVVAEWVAEDYPDLQVWTSAEVVAEFREYERFSTAVLDAGLGPVMSRYLDRFQARVRDAGVEAKPLLMHSAGGLATLDEGGRHPTITLLSGPAAGVLGSIHLGKRHNRKELLTFDMGGTSADLALVHNGKPKLLRLREVEGLPVLGSSLDISAVGAGGGSIAWIDAGGRLRVGPQSAGARPGPAAYGHGGTEPTVTDALVVCGLIPSNAELGASVAIHADAAQRAMEPLARELDLDPVATARAVLDVVNTNMALTARRIILERGLDPRDFVLVAFGGAGPMHAVDIARELGVSEVLIPATPGTMCAVGLLVSDQESEFVQAQIHPLGEESIEALNQTWDKLLAEARAWTARQHVEGGRAETVLRADMRYKGQHHSLSVELPAAPWDAKDLGKIRESFVAAHLQQNGYADPQEPIEVVNQRVLGRVVVPHAEQGTPAEPSTGSASPAGVVDVWWNRESPQSTQIVARASCAPGQRVEGPVLIIQEDTTIAVPEGATFVGLPDGAGLIDPGSSRVGVLHDAAGVASSR